MEASRDQNRVPTILGVSSVDGLTPVTIYVNPTTHRMLVDLGGSGGGSVDGPATSTDNAISRWDGTGGDQLQDSGVIISDTNNVSGINDLDVDGALTIGSLTGLLKGAAGVVSTATAGTDYYAPGSTDVAVADGGTGASTAAGARTNLGLVIGTDVQAQNAILSDLAGLTQAANKGFYFDTNTTAATYDLSAFALTLLDDANAGAARTTLGLAIGSDVQAYNATLATVAAGTYAGDDSIVTVGTLSAGDATAIVAAASASAAGKVELATDAETVTGTDTVRAVTPANLVAKMAAPGTIGGTTPANITGLVIVANTGFAPDANDGAYLGTSALGFSDLFLAEGGVINWDNGDLTLTQANNSLTLAGGEFNFGANTAYFTETDNGNSSTADTIDWKLSNKQKSTLTGNCTFTFTAPSGPCTLLLKLVQDGTGSRLVTWPAAVHWPGGVAPTLTTTASRVDVISFYYDGTTYFGNSALNYVA